MKSKKHIVMYCTAMILWGALFVFLIDLSAMGRIAKYDEVWWYLCSDLSEKSRFLCMVNHDVIGIICALAGLIFLTYKLVPVYKKQLLWTPLAGLLIGVFVWPIIQSLLYILLSVIL